jgi:hypothetical protein
MAHEPHREPEQLKLTQVADRFGTLGYPLSREAAARRFDEVTLVLADGEANLGAVIADCPADSFASAEELFEEFNAALPIEALGEPGQSDGDA